MPSIYEAFQVESEANSIYSVVPRDVRIFCADTGYDVAGMAFDTLIEQARDFDQVDYIYRNRPWQVLPPYLNRLSQAAIEDEAEAARIRDGALYGLRSDMAAATVYQQFGPAFPGYDTRRYLEHPVKMAATILAGRAVRRYYQSVTAAV